MAANKLPIFQTNPTPSGVSLVNGDGTAAKDLYTGGLEGSLVDNISVTSSDTGAVILVLTYNDGTSDFQLGELSIPAGSGTDGVTASVNLLDSTAMPFLQAGGGLPIATLSKITVAAKVAVSTGAVDIVAFGGDY